jgi:hypothetical protein
MDNPAIHLLIHHQTKRQAEKEINIFVCVCMQMSTSTVSRRDIYIYLEIACIRPPFSWLFFNPRPHRPAISSNAPNKAPSKTNVEKYVA